MLYAILQRCKSLLLSLRIQVQVLQVGKIPRSHIINPHIVHDPHLHLFWGLFFLASMFLCCRSLHMVHLCLKFRVWNR